MKIKFYDQPVALLLQDAGAAIRSTLYHQQLAHAQALAWSERAGHVYIYGIAPKASRL